MPSPTIPDPVAFVESRFGIHLRRVSSKEWAGPCIFCGGTDRFHVWDRGTYYCRPGAGHCGRQGWLDELDGGKAPTEQERTEWRLQALERQVQEHDRRLSLLEQMHECTDHATYHANLAHHPDALQYWYNEGLLRETVDKHELGYCSSCPTAPGYASYTIPVTYRGELYNIRHRLARPSDGGKYRPHVAGLPSMIFNADDLDREDDRILILEGEKKSMVVGQETGLANIATMGKTAFKASWAPKLDRFAFVYVCYDPDALAQAVEVARLFGKRGRVVWMPVKADEFYTRHGGTADEFLEFLAAARKVD